MTVYNKKVGDAPRGAIYIGRPSKWKNIFSHREGTKAEVVVPSRWHAVVAHYDMWASRAQELEPLRGKDLVCWCAPKMCHGHAIEALLNKQRFISVPERPNWTNQGPLVRGAKVFTSAMRSDHDPQHAHWQMSREEAREYFPTVAWALKNTSIRTMSFES